jgi:glycosyltransferase involved in cell wall biosynthesis
MKILYLCSSRYPTEKAYGVTIGNTFQKFKETDHDSEIVVWGKPIQDIYGNKILSIASHPIRLTKHFYSCKIPKISEIAFVINQLIFGVYFLFTWSNKKEETILWTREPLTLIPHSLFSKNTQYLIEIHHPASKLSQRIIQFLCKKHNVKIIVLSETSAQYHSKIFTKLPISVIPMGVPEKFFQSTDTKKSDLFTVGYIGKGKSSGNDNLLYEVIHAAKILQSQLKIRYKFIGLEKDYKEKMISMLKDLEVESDYFIFVDHVDHNKIPGELGAFDVGLLPYGESKYNAERFPIKLLEYSAAGLPIIATDTLVHRDLLNQEFTQFYSKDDPNKLAEAITKIKIKSEESQAMSESARKFAKKFTYDERVRKLLALIESVDK